VPWKPHALHDKRTISYSTGNTDNEWYGKINESGKLSSKKAPLRGNQTRRKEHRCFPKKKNGVRVGKRMGKKEERPGGGAWEKQCPAPKGHSVSIRNTEKTCQC